MVKFVSTIKNFGSRNGEKSGWIYLDIPAALAEQIKPGVRKSFRVKGKLDQHPIKQVALMPMGDGNFILPLNAALRKNILKPIGAKVTITLEADESVIAINAQLIECLADEPVAYAQFQKLAPSHQRYFSKWIESAKTEETKANRIARTIKAMLRGLDYGAMLRGE